MTRTKEFALDASYEARLAFARLGISPRRETRELQDEQVAVRELSDAEIEQATGGDVTGSAVLGAGAAIAGVGAAVLVVAAAPELAAAAAVFGVTAAVLGLGSALLAVADV